MMMISKPTLTQIFGDCITASNIYYSNVAVIHFPKLYLNKWLPPLGKPFSVFKREYLMCVYYFKSKNEKFIQTFFFL